jgi:hypothetical protein
MLTCPNCNHEDYPGTLFCSECGAPLSGLDGKKTQAFERKGIDSKALGQATSLPEMETLKEKARAYLRLVDHDVTMPLVEKQEFTIGRITEGQPILPDVDISMYDAYSQGVSRLHASFKIFNQRVTITDLGSSNGTRVNGQRIMPNVEYPLNNGDVIALGKLKIQIILPE